MKSIITLSVVLAVGLVLAGCGQNPEGNLAGTSATNSNIAGVSTNPPSGALTNLVSSTNMPDSTNQ